MSAPSSDRDGIIQLFELLAKAGYHSPAIWDGEEETPVKTAEEAADIVMNLDQAHLYVTKDDKTSWAFFVLGNDPEEVICDYTVDLEDVVGPLFEAWSE